MHDLTISIEPDALPEVHESLRALLEHANTEFGYPRNERQLLAVLRNSDGGIEGGVKAHAFWGWLYIAEIVVSTPWRGRGHGGRLLSAAESWGIECSCRDAWLQTMSFQARGFYERAGYGVFAELPNYPDKQVRMFMRKSLTVGSDDA